MIGPLLVPKPLLAIQIARRLRNTGNGDGRREMEMETETKKRSEFKTQFM